MSLCKPVDVIYPIALQRYDKGTNMLHSMNKLALAASVVTATALLGTGLAGCSRGTSTQQLVTDAAQYRQKGDNKAALIQLKNAAAKSPEDMEVRLLLGNLYLDTGDLLTAEKEIRKAASLGMKPERTMPPLAKVLLAQGKAQEALDETAAAGAGAPRELVATRAVAYLATNQPAKAKALFDELLKADPANVDALLGMARYAYGQNDFKEANRYVDEAIARNPTNAQALMFKAAALRAEGKGEQALALYDQVVAADPNNRDAHLEKAQVLISANKSDAARAEIAAANKVTPNSPQVLYTQALLDYREGKSALALENIQKVLRLAPEHMPSLLLAGLAELNTGANVQAELHLKTYLASNPSHFAARQAYVNLLLEANRPADALAAVTPLLKDNDNAAALALVGKVYLKLRDYNKATIYLEKASALAPNAAWIQTSLAMSKLGQGDRESAVRDLERSTKLDASSPQAGIILAMTELRLKHFDKAMAAANALEKEMPDNPIVQNLKGAILLGQHNLPGATASFEKALVLQPSYFPAVAYLMQMAVQDKKPELAKKRLEAFLAKNPKHYETMRELSALAQYMGHPEEATSWLERAQAENPDAVAPALQLLSHYLNNGQAAKALPLASKLLAANPSNEQVMEMLGQLQLATNDKNAALETYNKWVNLTPKSPLAHYRMGEVHIAMNNVDAAADDMKKALALRPSFYEAQMGMAKIALGRRNYDQALAIARQMQKSKDLSGAGFGLEGDILMAQGKPQAAAEQYQKAAAIVRNAPLLVKIHTAMTQAGNGKQADTLMTQWLKDYPDDPQLPMYAAESSLARQQYKVAISQFEAILKRQPKNLVAMNNLAWAYHKENDPRALPTAEQAYRLASDKPEIIDTLGWILVEQGNTTRGLPLLQKAVELAPAALDIRLHLGSGLLKAGDKPRARRELEQVVLSGAKLPQADEARTLLKLL
jgi:putative PEP-CTERM system TPR-repeat lipoprotein